MLSKLATFLYIHCVVYRRSIVDRRKALFLVMAHLHYRRRTWVRTRARTPLLHRNREYRSESESSQCEHVLHSTM